MPLVCQALGSDLGDKRCFSLNIWIILGIWKVPHSPCFEHSVTSMKWYFEVNGTFRSWVLVGRNGLVSVAFEGYTFPWFWSSFLMFSGSLPGEQLCSTLCHRYRGR